MVNKKAQTQPIVQQPIVVQPKKSKTWIWILIILIIVGVSLGLFFWLSGSDGGSIGNLGGSSIPQPPALPK